MFFYIAKKHDFLYQCSDLQLNPNNMVFLGFQI